MNEVLRYILPILFDSANPALIAVKVLYIIGLWKLLMKMTFVWFSRLSLSLNFLMTISLSN